jgi:Fe-S-cluster containining protein
MDCQCDVCCGACTKKPGWFLPGQAEKAAELLGLSLKEFFHKYLGIDYFIQKDGKFLYVLAPAIVTMEPGQEYPFSPFGQCVFYENNMCKIHAAKPIECAKWDHSVDDKELLEFKNVVIVGEWEKHQDQIEELLGRKPQQLDVGWGEVLGLFADGFR